MICMMNLSVLIHRREFMGEYGVGVPEAIVSVIEKGDRIGDLAFR